MGGQGESVHMLGPWIYGNSLYLLLNFVIYNIYSHLNIYYICLKNDI